MSARMIEERYEETERSGVDHIFQQLLVGVLCAHPRRSQRSPRGTLLDRHKDQEHWCDDDMEKCDEIGEAVLHRHGMYITRTILWQHLSEMAHVPLHVHPP